MKVLVTGAAGFIASNLISELERREDVTVLPFEHGDELALLDKYCSECDFVYNLAGVNRPKDEEEFMAGNYGFALSVAELLEKHGNTCPFVFSSSIQATMENSYGRSKKAGEDALFSYGKRVGARVLIYRFPNVFGKWCKPNYNSAVATFCHNIARDIPIQVSNRNTQMQLVYIDDLVQELIAALEEHPHVGLDGYCFVDTVHKATLGEIVNLLYSFKESRRNLLIPDLTEGTFEKKLYSTYLSYLPADGFAYPLIMHADERGSFTEFLKSANRGQVSVNITKPGIEKGNHWHHTKNEKFLVVSGRGKLSFRRHGSDEIIEYHVSGERLEVVDIPTGYVHALINEGDTDLVTLMWCNECFNPNKSDTIHENVENAKENDNG